MNVQTRSAIRLAAFCLLSITLMIAILFVLKNGQDNAALIALGLLLAELLFLIMAVLEAQEIGKRRHPPK